MKRLLLFFCLIFLFILVDARQNFNKRRDIDNVLPLTPTSIRLDLGGIWDIENSAQNVSTTGTVPGEIQTDLMQNGVINDPYYRYNDVEYRWIALLDWYYSRSFEVSEELYSNEKILLVCYGIDTISTILINNEVIGTTDNQFRRYIFDVKNFLKLGQNRIEVKFQSAGTYASNQAKNYPYPLPESTSQQHSHGEMGRGLIRKESCSFAWDWGPCFMPQGIWKPIELIGYSTPLLIDFYPQVFNENNGGFKILASFDFKAITSTQITISVIVAGISSQKSFTLIQGDNTVSLEFIVPSNKIDLWWPIGYGEANLYELIATINSNGIVYETSKRIGFRSFQLVQEPYPDQSGQSFYFRINGIPIWSKGSNLIPQDAFESRVTKETVDRLLHNAIDANMNTIRIWGGGVYQNDYLYDLSDELGLIVWEEFMFACALYPVNQDFLETVKEEAKHQIIRLMHHPSIVLWSGNNENEQSITEKWYPESTLNPFIYTIDYDILYHQILRQEFLSTDKSRQYISSSPSNGIVSENPFTERWITEDGGTSNNQKYGDNHYYNYVSDCEDVYSMVSPRFSSEYGFQSSPSFETLKSVTVESDWAWDSPLLKFRNHRTGDGQEEISRQLQYHFLFPTNSDRVLELQNFIYLSQTAQGLCYRAQTEHYRRSKTQEPNTMGALYWQLNDIWQASTWSSLEYGGRWKILHYYVKNFFSPLLVSSYRMIDEIYDVHVTSDIVSPISGNVQFDVWSWTGVKKNSTTIPFELESLGSKSVLKKSYNELCNNNLHDCLFILSVSATSQTTQETFTHSNFHFPLKPKEASLLKPQISWTINSSEERTSIVSITSNVVAPFVFLETPIHGRFSDNGFVLLPNQQNTISFFGWEDYSLDELRTSLKVKSLYDALPQSN